MQSITIVITLLEADRSPLPIARWAQVKGYDADFLKTLRIDLAKIYAPVLAKGEVAPLLDNSGHELAYHHFTSVIQAMRKFPLLTAVNINGKGLVHPGKRKDTWRRDARIDEKFQPGGDFYEKAKGAGAVQFSRGHQVRLFDPCWSDALGPGTGAGGIQARRRRHIPLHQRGAASSDLQRYRLGEP